MEDTAWYDCQYFEVDMLVHESVEEFVLGVGLPRRIVYQTGIPAAIELKKEIGTSV